jgi:endonuclease YncB( thermonuclease family)
MSSDAPSLDYEGILKAFNLYDDRLWHYRAFICRIIDGDTVVALIDKGFGNMQIEKLRLAGIDTPELRPRKGTPEEREAEKVEARKAKERVKELLEHREVVIRTAKTGKFGRFLAHIYLPENKDKTINDLLLEEGLAEEYPRS